jgi:hypothetical protein
MNTFTKKLVRFFCIAAVVVSTSAAYAAPRTSATAHPFGLGLVLGEPTGLSAKLWTEPYKAIDFGLAFSLDSYFLIFSDYLFHFKGAFGSSHTFLNQLTPYLGIGGLLAFASYTNDGKHRHFYGTHDSAIGLGARVPLGIEWIAPDPRIGVFIEIVPGLAIIPRTAGFVDAGIGARYYF